MKNLLFTLCTFTILSTFLSCTGNKESEKTNTKNTDTIAPIVEVETPKVKAPIINIQDSLEVKQDVLCIKDSSNTIEGMYQKLSNIYNIKLQEIIKASKVQVMGSPMAWQTVEKNAYFFEAGIPVDRAPSKMGKGMYMKSTGDDSAAVAHFWGPQNISKSAYDALDEKLTDMHKTKSAAVYEIYKGDYFPTNNTAVDFYKLQIDIVMPYKGYIAPKIKEVKYTDKELQINSKTKSKTKTKLKVKAKKQTLPQ